MRLTGTALWRPSSDGSQPAAWTQGSWSICDGRISTAAQPRAADEEELTGWIIPGLVDVHCHIGLGPHGPVDQETQIRQAQADRDSGVLLMRDCGSPVDTSHIQHDPTLPHLIRCGTHLSRPKRYIRGISRELATPSQLPEAVAQEAARSDGWVKIVGDWIDRSEGSESDLRPLWPGEVLRDAVAAAHESGARLTAHTFSHAAIDDLLAAGVDGIEHGSGMDDDQLSEARRQGVVITPTLCQIELFESFAQAADGKFARYAQTMRTLYEGRHDHYERLFDSGVHLLPGTDAGGYQDHGSLPAELARWHAAGLPPAKILDIATWQARDALGYPSLYDGAPADCVVYEADPRADITELSRPVAVILGGTRVA